MASVLGGFSARQGGVIFVFGDKPCGKTGGLRQAELEGAEASVGSGGWTEL